MNKLVSIREVNVPSAIKAPKGACTIYLVSVMVSPQGVPLEIAFTSLDDAVDCVRNIQINGIESLFKSDDKE